MIHFSPIKKRYGYVLVGLALLFFSGCAEKKEDISTSKQTLFNKIPSSESGLTFTNQIKPNTDFNILEYNYFYNGGGVAAGDFNNDGLDDLFFTGNMVGSAFYINKGDLVFEELTKVSGLETEVWVSGASVVDINADGLLDLYLCVAGYPEEEKRKNLLFINQGIDGDGVPKFEEKADAYGLADAGYSTQAAFFDYDLDGDLDVFIANVYHDKSNPNLPRPKINDGSAKSTDKLYENLSEKCTTPDCQIEFRDISKKAGILKEGYGLGLAINDFNQDGWPDVFVSNDFIFNDLLYINNQDGTFSEKADKAFRHQSQFSMGTDVADINHDALPDIVVLDMLPEDNLRQKQMNIAMNYDRFVMALDNGYLPQYSRNVLHLHQGEIEGEPRFSEVGLLAGIHQTDWSWSPLWADFDMDGSLDLFISNGIPKDITDSDYIVYRDQKVMKGDYDYDVFKQELLRQLETLPPVDKSNYVFKNSGNLSFKDATTDWGIKQPSFSNGAVAIDLDNDGDLEIVTNNLGKEVFLYENTSDQNQGKHHFLKVKLKGSEKNKLGLGSSIEVITSQKKYHLYYHPVHGFQSSNAAPAYFALGQDSLVSKIKVTWADGKVDSIVNIKADASYSFKYGKANSIPSQKQNKKIQPQLMQLVDSFLEYEHKENYFVDFKFEPLLPRQYSKQGPAIAVADVDKNGLEDVFIGGTVKEKGQLFLQQKNGNFKTVAFPDENYEDTGALFFDADNDGDQDLYVVSGGNEYNAKTAPYQDRLYLNDGKGNFTKAKDALPQIYSSGNAVVALDYDQDGDQDLFVGGRVFPGSYPLPAESVLLENNGGKFKNVTGRVFKGLEVKGMVTDAIVTDFDNDGWQDLLVTGEFMPLMFLKNNQGKFENISANTGLGDKKGWWYSLAQGDFDNDGDMDFVAGNLGLNSKLKADLDKPITVKASDFNKDQSIDAVLGYYLDDENGNPQLFPFHSRDVLAGKIRPIRRYFPTYISFSKATLQEVLANFKVDNVYSPTANYMQSVYVENLGDGKYEMHPLPLEAQFAPINSLLVEDFDGDGHLDVLVAGNSYASEFTAGWYDASNGLLLMGNGKGKFTTLTTQKSGFFAEGETRSLAVVRDNNGHAILLVGRNDLEMLTYKLKFVPLKMD